MLERITSIVQTGTSNGAPTNATVQDLSYTCDALNNLSSRHDLAGSAANTINTGLETFQYDNLERLVSHTQGTNTVNASTVTVNYDAIGNITHKSDVGSYHYQQNSSGRNTHRLQSITNPGASATSVAKFDINWDFDGQQVMRSQASTDNMVFEYDANGSVTHSTLPRAATGPNGV